MLDEWLFVLMGLVSPPCEGSILWPTLSGPSTVTNDMQLLTKVFVASTMNGPEWPLGMRAIPQSMQGLLTWRFMGGAPSFSEQLG